MAKKKQEEGYQEGKHELPGEVTKRAGTTIPPNARSPRQQRAMMHENPELAKAFDYKVEQPVYQLKLPSRGLLYDDRLPEGMLDVMPLTAREEKLLAGAEGDVTDVIETLFSRCVILDNGMTPKDFLSSDRLYTLIMLRAHSYGQLYEFSVPCDSCGYNIQKSLNIPDDLDIVYLEDNEQDEPYEVTLPRSGKRVGFRLPRGTDEIDQARYTERMRDQSEKKKRRKRAPDQGDPAYSYRVASLIVTLDGIDVSNKSLQSRKIEFFEQLIGEDSIALQTAIRDHDCGVDVEMHETCPRCKKKNVFMMPFTAEFFRPTSRGEGTSIK